MLRLFVINPGSTSTKVGVFEDGKEIFSKSVKHSGDVMKNYPDLKSQMPFREGLIRKIIEEENIDLSTMDAFVGRGGVVHPLVGGVYEVNEAMKDDLESCRYGWHSSNMGGLLADVLAKPLGRKAYIADPVIVDEFEPLARVSGWPEIERISIFHALNQKAVARRYAKEHGQAYDELNLIVVHMGGGVSIGAHQKGRVIDVNNALTGDGPFSVERTGDLPLFSLIELCYSGQYTEAELKAQLVGHGGLIAYLHTSDGLEIDDRIEAGDDYARYILEAMGYQISKEIGSAATVLKGDVDQIILTGGLGRDPFLVDWITERTAWIAPITLYPGEDELGALADAVSEALAGNAPIRQYEKETE